MSLKQESPVFNNTALFSIGAFPRKKRTSFFRSTELEAA